METGILQEKTARSELRIGIELFEPLVPGRSAVLNQRNPGIDE